MSDKSKLSEWQHKDLQELVILKDKNIDHYLERIQELETELETTRKALDVAVDALKEIKALDDNGNYDIEDYDCQVAKITTEALEQITALEQKDK